MKRTLSGLILAALVALAAGGCPGGILGGNPSVSVTIDKTAIAEDGEVAVITATLSAASAQPVEVALRFEGTAVSGTDYTRSAMSITVPARATSASITITGVTDSMREGDKELVIIVDSVTGGTLATDPTQFSLAITDNDGLPTVSLSRIGTIDDPLPEEIDDDVPITATLSAPAAEEVVVHLAFSGTATLDADYKRSDTRIVIPPGKTSEKIVLNSIDDDEYDNGETIIIAIDSITGPAEITAEAEGQEVTIKFQDDDEAPKCTLTVSSNSGEDDGDGDETTATIDERGGVATIKGTLDKAIAVDSSVEFTVTGSAKYMKDYTLSSFTLTIPAGQTEGTITLAAEIQGVYEGDEKVVLDVSKITNLVGDGGTGIITVTIKDDVDPPKVTLNVTGSPLPERGGKATLKVTQSALSAVDTTVVLKFSGSATQGTDYKVSPGETAIVIPAGELEGKTELAITAVDDMTYEGAKTIDIEITSVANAEEDGGVQQVSIPIVDDETQPSVTLLLGSTTISHAGEPAATQLTVRLSNASYEEVTVNLTYAGTAVQGTDYTIPSGEAGTKIKIAAGKIESALPISAVRKPADGTDQTVVVSIDSVEKATEGNPSEVTLTITD